MAHLFPAAVDSPEQAAGAHGEGELYVVRAKITTFPAHCIEHFPDLVQGVVVVLDVDVGRTFEDPRVPGMYLPPCRLMPPRGLSMTTSSACAQFFSAIISISRVLKARQN
jgi:hypothetical protein